MATAIEVGKSWIHNSSKSKLGILPKSESEGKSLMQKKKKSTIPNRN